MTINTQPSNPHRVLFAGDIHGSRRHARWLFGHAGEVGATDIVACGDFGYWPHEAFGTAFLDTVRRLTGDTGITLWWVDGNHENHDRIDGLVAEHGSGAPIEVAGPDVRYIPRGCVVDFGGTSLMGFGGAFSVDREWREPGTSWWPQELITPEQVAALPSRTVDILVTHEAPLGRVLGYKDDIPESVDQRFLVQEVQDRVRPALHVCGHHHVNRAWYNGATEVHVIGRDGMGADSVLFVDLDERFGRATAA